tara:strand:- start:180 stop:368 length:189 start_codon:yes stop_codon:yes gene_type:complete
VPIPLIVTAPVLVGLGVFALDRVGDAVSETAEETGNFLKDTVVPIFVFGVSALIVINALRND